MGPHAGASAPGFQRGTLWARDMVACRVAGCKHIRRACIVLHVRRLRLVLVVPWLSNGWRSVVYVLSMVAHGCFWLYDAWHAVVFGCDDG